MDDKPLSDDEIDEALQVCEFGIVSECWHLSKTILPRALNEIKRLRKECQAIRETQTKT